VVVLFLFVQFSFDILYFLFTIQLTTEFWWDPVH